ncbi:tail fiber protein [Erwinia phage Faunus]|uniref:Putative tail fiber protein n=1 Tax=Erwinia phage Faunus TaxID=2182346 RepID=A0A2U8UWM1_9CAUD|nr:tail fiber protein [Erwinia phage Faunus]AWN08655.1 putative tail fiber protein [Erwinia phage Faunus]
MALRPKLNRIWASENTNLRRDPGDAKYITGWVAEIPTYQVLNFLQYKNDLTLLALAERGIFEWGSDVSYSVGSLAWDEYDGKIYVCTSPEPGLSRPSVSGAWKPSSVQITRVEFDSAKATWTAHIQDVTSNPHKLTPSMLNAYTKDEVDAILTQYRNFVSAHASRTDNPHDLTAAKVGAVPITGGKYTGDVEMGTRRIFLSPNGGHKIAVETDVGPFIEANSAVLGIDISSGIGKPMAGSTLAGRSEIITEATFDANKLQIENLYAVPQPDFYMPNVGSVNVHIGSQTIDGSYEPQYGVGGWLRLVPAIGASRALNYSDCPLEGVTECTIALDIKYEGPTGTDVGNTDYRYSIGFGTFPQRVAFAFVGGPTRTFRALSDNYTSPMYALPSTTPHRLVISRAADRVRVYVDGVQFATTPIAASVLSGVGYGINMTGTTSAAANESPLLISNLRAWRGVLSAEQISRL